MKKTKGPRRLEWMGFPEEVFLQLMGLPEETGGYRTNIPGEANSMSKDPEAGRNKSLWHNRKTMVTKTQEQTNTR
jgi:hypothetical protein